MGRQPYAVEATYPSKVYRQRPGKKPKATCPVCGRPAPVNRGRKGRPNRGPAAGTIGWHAPRLGLGRAECPGTGSEPAT
jgi:hypothetical protein